MSTADIAIVMTAYFLAAFSKGITGLGFSTTCLAILAVAIGLKPALPLMIIPSLASNIIVMRDAGHFRETLWRFWPLLLAAAPGVVLGLWLLSWVAQAQAAAVLGVVLMGYAVFALANPNLTLPARWERPLQAPVGLLTGLVNGLTGSQLMPVMPYLLALRLPPNPFVQAINCSFTFSSLIMAVGLQRIGLMTVQTALISSGGVVLVWLGIALGSKVRRRLSVETFRFVVLCLLILFGIGLVTRPFFA